MNNDELRSHVYNLTAMIDRKKLSGETTFLEENICDMGSYLIHVGRAFDTIAEIVLKESKPDQET